MKPLAVVVGAGQTGRLLVPRLASHWRLSVVDKDPAALERLRARPLPEGIRLLQGDGTSALVLRDAGAEEAQALVALVGDDEVAYEVCRQAKERFRVLRLLTIMSDRRHARRLKELGVEALSVPFTAASILSTYLDIGRRTTTDVGLGRGEILEVTAQPGSPVLGKTLADLHPQSWLVGAIYRRGDLVVPHGDTVIEERDRVLLLGDPTILAGIADFFRPGTSRFPLQYGARIVVANPAGHPPGAVVDEAAYLASASRALGLTLVAHGGLGPERLPEPSEGQLECRAREAPEGWTKPLSGILIDEDCGCLVVPGPPRDLRLRLGLGPRALDAALDWLRRPMLLSRGTFPYRRVLLAVSTREGVRRAAELAFDLAGMLDAELEAVTALPPAFVGGERANQELEAALDQIRLLGSLYSQKVRTRVLRGNPVRSVVAEAGGRDLLITAHRSGRRFSLTRPDVSWLLTLQATCSTLVLPYRGESG